MDGRDALPIRLDTDEALTLLIDGATNYAIYMLGPDGRVAIWNRGAERIKGWSEDEIIGRSARIFYVPEDIAAGKLADELARATDVGRIEEESWRVRKDGSRFLANVTVTALRDRHGTLRGFGKVVRDITDQRHAQAAIAERECQLAAILATVPDAMIILDAEHRILSFSRTAEQLFGHEEGAILGRPIAHLLQIDEGPSIFDAAPAPVVGRQLIARRHDGSAFPIELAFDRISHGAANRVIVFLRDLSDRERTANEIHRLRARLARGARANLLGIVGSTLAHELNQPIAAVVNYAGALRDALARKVAPALVDEALCGIIEEAMRAGAIVRQLRNFVATGELEKRPCNLTDLIQESVRTQIGALSAHHIALRLVFDHDETVVIVERIQIQQVIVNLVRNAIEAMAGAKRRELTIATRKLRSKIRVAVTDTGCGIDDEIAPRLFEPFNGRKADGLGVGLSICRSIVEAHGGGIGASSRRGLTRISFTIPLGPAVDGR